MTSNTNHPRPTTLSMMNNALIQFAVAAFTGTFIATSVLVFSTGKAPLPESPALTHMTYGIVITVTLFFLVNYRNAKKQKASYVAAGGNKNTNLIFFMLGDMGGEANKDGIWQPTSQNTN